jgi:hypothetical protein
MRRRIIRIRDLIGRGVACTKEDPFDGDADGRFVANQMAGVRGKDPVTIGVAVAVAVAVVVLLVLVLSFKGSVGFQKESACKLTRGECTSCAQN